MMVVSRRLMVTVLSSCDDVGFASPYGDEIAALKEYINQYYNKCPSDPSCIQEAAWYLCSTFVSITPFSRHGSTLQLRDDSKSCPKSSYNHTVCLPFVCMNIYGDRHSA